MTATRTTGSCLRVEAIDQSPALMEQSYRLRYQVYCHERGFLPAESYPDGLERDAFDRTSTHVGVIDLEGSLVATGRAVSLATIGLGLPLFRHCRIFANETELIDPDYNVVEISRVAISRAYRRPRGDAAAQRREVRGEAFLTLLKGLYHVTTRMDATHWLAAIEKPLHRLLLQHGFPFRVIGPEANYAGPVAPYLMNLREFDEVIRSGDFPGLLDYSAGLDRGHQPASAGARPQSDFDLTAGGAMHKFRQPIVMV
ncbi:MAG TPA: PEP-CTERM/exosortase system-associated acyltransferase [Vicinamibacterales bacterium]|nr:PEP-CTERM/exosortase system-associated acyltransferase [Vicinamibacterales bacterium]